MARAEIPVDIFNPGQVLACLGFMEAAEILLGDAEGGFDWSTSAEVRFILKARGEENPFGVVLKFLAGSEIVVIRPAGIAAAWPPQAKEVMEFPASPRNLKDSKNKGFSNSSLPLMLCKGDTCLLLSHWLERERLSTCKLFAGQQASYKLANNMLNGDCGKSNAQGLKDIFPQMIDDHFSAPFNITCSIGGRFGFDARGGWDAGRIGTSLDKTGVSIDASPHVELLSAVGLENTRPLFPTTYEMQYSVWEPMLPVMLARLALAYPKKFLASAEYRTLLSHLGEDKQYKKMFYSEEVVSK